MSTTTAAPPMVVERSCCCPSRPSWAVLVRESDEHPLLLCRHHFRRHLDALSNAHQVTVLAAPTG